MGESVKEPLIAGNILSIRELTRVDALLSVMRLGRGTADQIFGDVVERRLHPLESRNSIYKILATLASEGLIKIGSRATREMDIVQGRRSRVHTYKITPAGMMALAQVRRALDATWEGITFEPAIQTAAWQAMDANRVHDVSNGHLDARAARSVPIGVDAEIPEDADDEEFEMPPDGILVGEADPRPPPPVPVTDEDLGGAWEWPIKP